MEWMYCDGWKDGMDGMESEENEKRLDKTFNVKFLKILVIFKIKIGYDINCERD